MLNRDRHQGRHLPETCRLEQLFHEHPREYRGIATGPKTMCHLILVCPCSGTNIACQYGMLARTFLAPRTFLERAEQRFRNDQQDLTSDW